LADYATADVYPNEDNPLEVGFKDEGARNVDYK
jgi:hypothetical protein